MDSIRRGGSTTHPPVLDETNYSYWKDWIIAFLKSIDSKTWKAIVIGWSPPQVTNKNGAVSLRP